jgi:hypothetical protein
MINIEVIVTIRMTKLEVERDIFPNLEIPPGAYFYWYEYTPMMKWGDIEVPTMIGKEQMMVEVVDEKDLYKLPTDDDDCDCPFCTGKFPDLF